MEKKFEMNFYKDVGFNLNQKVETIKTTDRFEKIRLFLNEVQNKTEEDKLKSLFPIRCIPTIISRSVVEFEKMYFISFKKRSWYNKKCSDSPAIKQILNNILTSNNEDLWSKVITGSLTLSSCSYLTITYVIIEIIIQTVYLCQPFPEHYSRLIMFLVNWDVIANKNMFHKFCDYIKWKILFDNKNLQVSGVVLLAKFYAMVYTLEGNADILLDFIYDALYFLKNLGHSVVFTVLTVWPEIFPKCRAHGNGIIFTMAFVILNHSMERNGDRYFVIPLRKMLMEQYEYKHGKKTAEELLAATMNHISQSEWLKAILLLCRRRDVLWTYEVVLFNNIIPIINLWIEEGSQTVQDWLLVKCIHVTGTIFRNTERIQKLYPVQEAVQLFENILFSNHQPSFAVQSAVIVQLWNVSTVKFSPSYEVLIKWSSRNDAVSNNYFEDLTTYLWTMGYHLPVRGIWKTLLALARNNSPIDVIAAEEQKLRQTVKKKPASVAAVDRLSVLPKFKMSKANLKKSFRKKNKHKNKNKRNNKPADDGICKEITC